MAARHRRRGRGITRAGSDADLTTRPRRRHSASPTPTDEPTPSGGALARRPALLASTWRRKPSTSGFRCAPDTRYHYRDNFLDPREGPPDDYNHVRVNADGTVHRLHDGIDIYAAVGEPLVATFSGTVINPGTRWPPWEADRYGNTVAIVSDEPATNGYTSIYVHADRVWVQLGDHVTRGQVVGTVGRTGNAETQSVHSHLHFEIWAPFLLDWSAVGEDQVVDAFNPYPSLVAADPKRT